MSTPITLTDEITVELINAAGGDYMVVAAAKVSTCGEDARKFAEVEAAEGNAGLINYLMKHRHGTPFEHGLLTVFVSCPAFVWWQWVRHRVGHSYNLESSRYRELDPLFWVPRIDRKIKPSPDHKPSRPEFVPDEMLTSKTRNRLFKAYKVAYAAYEAMVADGVANEVARAVLPFGVYFSGWVTVNPRSLMAFLSLRTHEPSATFVSRPQAEIEQAARAAERFLETGWPITHAAFVRNGRVAP